MPRESMELYKEARRVQSATTKVLEAEASLPDGKAVQNVHIPYMHSGR